MAETLTGMIALAHIESTAIGLHAFDDLRNQDIGVGIPVAVGVRGEIVRNQIGADLEELRDGLPMIARHAGREY